MNAGEEVAVVFLVLSMMAALTFVSGDWVAPTEAASRIKTMITEAQASGQQLQFQEKPLTDAVVPTATKNTLRLKRAVEKPGLDTESDEITFQFVSPAKGYETFRYGWTNTNGIWKLQNAELRGAWILKFTGYRNAFEKQFKEVLRVRATNDAEAKGQPGAKE